MPLRASGKASLGEAILYSTQPRMFADPAEQAGFDRVAAAVTDDPLRRRLLLLLPRSRTGSSTW